jgi:hypothetical protein
MIPSQWPRHTESRVNLNAIGGTHGQSESCRLQSTLSNCPSHGQSVGLVPVPELRLQGLHKAEALQISVCRRSDHPELTRQVRGSGSPRLRRAGALRACPAQAQLANDSDPHPSRSMTFVTSRSCSSFPNLSPTKSRVNLKEAGRSSRSSSHTGGSRPVD